MVVPSDTTGHSAACASGTCHAIAVGGPAISLTLYPLWWTSPPNVVQRLVAPKQMPRPHISPARQLLSQPEMAPPTPAPPMPRPPTPEPPTPRPPVPAPPAPRPPTPAPPTPLPPTPRILPPAPLPPAPTTVPPAPNEPPVPAPSPMGSARPSQPTFASASPAATKSTTTLDQTNPAAPCLRIGGIILKSPRFRADGFGESNAPRRTRDARRSVTTWRRSLLDEGAHR